VTIQGELRLLSAVSVRPAGVAFAGSLRNAPGGCVAKPALELEAQVVREPASGATLGQVRRRTTRLASCARGDADLRLSARALRFACAGGGWKPGRYTFELRTRMRPTRLTSVVALTWKAGRLC